MITIRVNKATDPGAWYAKHIGTVLLVERVEINRHPSQGIPEDVYWCREGGTYNPINYVRKSDATETTAMSQTKSPTPPPLRGELLAKTVINQILSHPETWEQRAWHSPCRTRHCFAGWCQIMAGKPPCDATAQVDAAEALGLNQFEAEWFFRPTCSLPELHHLAANFGAGYNRDGYNRDGFDRAGYNRAGYNRDGFDRAGYNRAGYNRDGYNRDGFDRAGYNRAGYNRAGYNRDGFDRAGEKLKPFDLNS